GSHGPGNDVGDQICGELHNLQDHFHYNPYDLYNKSYQPANGLRKCVDDTPEERKRIGKVAQAERSPQSGEQAYDVSCGKAQPANCSGDSVGRTVYGAAFLHLLKLRFSAIHQAHEGMDHIFHRKWHGPLCKGIPANQKGKEEISSLLL